MTFQQELLAEFDRDLERGADLVNTEYVRLVQADPSTPRDSGALADGIEAARPSVTAGRVRTEVTSTYRAPGGADVGTILDQSTGKLVTARSKGKRAFGPFAKPVPTRGGGTTRFLPEFHVTTKHVGWWENANDEAHWRAAVNQLSKVNL